jgi:hypothetical protein
MNFEMRLEDAVEFLETVCNMAECFDDMKPELKRQFADVIV